MKPEQHVHTLPNFHFHTGEVLPELRLHCAIWGHPQGQPVLLLHGTNGSALGLVTPEWQQSLFGPGQALDLERHRVIVPDALGCGRSSKPSNGMRTRFPRYNYADMVQAQYRLLTEALGVQHLRAIIGYSMGGMHAWLWAQHHPTFMDRVVPMACMPTPISGRNWMMRRMVIDAIRNDPEWQGGDYRSPLRSAHAALTYYAVATSGGNWGLYKAGHDQQSANAWLDAKLAQAPIADANDALYQYEAASDYDASSGLENIQARILTINNTDDERNPPELGLLEQAMARVHHGQSLWVKGSDRTSGHATLGSPRFWVEHLASFMNDN
jgi:homoserine O-acetyltransferase/O-succinyltransferase